MLTLTNTPEFVLLPVGTVAAACPPVRPWRVSAPLSEQLAAAVSTGFSGIALSAPEFAGIVGGAKPAGPAKAAVNDGADLLQLNRQYHTMSRRDHRTWRPPH